MNRQAEPISKSTADLRKVAQAHYVNGNVEQAVAVMHKCVLSGGANVRISDLKLLAHYQFAQDDYSSALSTVVQIDILEPNKPETLKNFAVCHTRMRQYQLALEYLRRALVIDKNDPAIHDGLAHVYGDLGQMRTAIRHGEAALRLKAEGVSGVSPIATLRGVKVPPFERGVPARNVIAFSLWGNNYRYCEGAIENARMVRELYPDWHCRFYCDDSVPQAAIGALVAEGAVIVFMRQRRRLHEGLFWRFHVCWDANIDRYLIRDADSVVNIKERLAVDEWIASKKHFHLLRDYYTHTDLILAGMWGGVRGALPNLEPQFDAFLDQATKPRTCDQNFLREIVWPVARQSYLLHDSHFSVLRSKPYPVGASLKSGHHVGQDAVYRPKAEPGIAFVRGPHDSIPQPHAKRQKFLFTISAGRTGTTFLARLLQENLQSCEVHHERTGYHNFGVHTPDASHFTLFNSVGNVPQVQEFWRRKLGATVYGETNSYAEISHYLAKAGLLENLNFLDSSAEIHVICLTRDVEAVVWSFANRMDFANLGFTWLFTLDPRYSRNIVSVKAFEKYEMFGRCFWYAVEMLARAAYYRMTLSDKANLHFHKVDLSDIATEKGAMQLLQKLGCSDVPLNVRIPSRQNELVRQNVAVEERTSIRNMIARTEFDPEALAAKFIAAGRTIG